MYNMYDTCGTLAAQRLYDNETTCAIFPCSALFINFAIGPFGINTLVCRTLMYSDDTQPGRAALIDPRTSSCCADSIPGPC